MPDQPEVPPVATAATKRLYWAGWWRFGSYNIGSTKVLMLGPVRWFRRD